MLVSSNTATAANHRGDSNDHDQRSTNRHLVKITFHGAAETVTGSRFLVETTDSRILVDCGLFQGLKRLRRKNWEPFPQAPSSIDAVLVTHAHIDHSGFLPALVRDGFRGPIWCTPGTAALLRLLLLDSAHLQEEEARFANKHRTSKHNPALPLYTTADALSALERVRTTALDTPFLAATGCEASFHRAGHIIGSSTIRIVDRDTSVLFTGDLGRPDDPVLAPPAPPREADYLVTESTYGNRLHNHLNPASELAKIVRSTSTRGGSVLIPSFAVGRAQSILHFLVELREEEAIADIPIYLNSPMSIEATELLGQFPSEHRLGVDECWRLQNGVQYVRTAEESKALNDLRGPMIIVSASGMATGGRVLHHLRALAPDHRNHIVFAGFQAAGTRGEALVSGARRIKIFGQYVPVRADVSLLRGLSAHADQQELLDWLGQSPTIPTTTFVVHGESSAADTMRRSLHDELGWHAVVPQMGESFELVPAARQPGFASAGATENESTRSGTMGR